MKIALTGGTGFIGSHFLKQALPLGHEILAIRRDACRQPRIQLNYQPDWLECLLDDVEASQLEGCKVLLHLAAHTGNVPYDTLHNCLRWNVNAVLNLFEQARLAGIRRFVVAGSCFEYGRSGEQYHQIPTDAPLEPTNAYAASKAAASIILKQWAEHHDLSLDILRVFHVFGEGEPESRFWPSLRKAALEGADFSMTKGEQIRDFISVEDAARIFLRRSTVPSATSPGVNIFNIGSGNSISIKAFAETCWRQFGAAGDLRIGEIPYRSGEVMRFVPGHELLLPFAAEND